MSNIVHKVKEAVSGHHDKHSSSTNAGPHDSNLANKADPRVDSDRDHRAAHTSAGTTGGVYDTTTTGTTGGAYDATTAGTTGTSGLSSGGAYDNTRSTNAGPHDSNLANKMDPRVDSDLDNRAQRTTGTTTGGLSSGGAYNTRSTNAGPHDSNVANKLDPRVDSDRSQYGTGATTGTTTGGLTSGGAYDNTRSTNAGPHGSNVANKLDPRVDSDLDNRARHQELGASGSATAGNSYNTPGSGNAQQTAGPHDSNLANKLDPRVDSDLDGSRTVGGNATRY